MMRKSGSIAKIGSSRVRFPQPQNDSAAAGFFTLAIFGGYFAYMMFDYANYRRHHTRFMKTAEEAKLLQKKCSELKKGGKREE